MNVTRRCDYAFRILRAAFKKDDQYVSVSEIAENECIPYAFARSIQNDLMKAGFIKTTRGAHGGLILNCDPHEATVLDVMEAIQGPVSVSICAEDPYFCSLREGCALNSVWHGADKLLNEYFASISLADILTLGSDHPSVSQVLGSADVYDKWMTNCSENKNSEAPEAEQHSEQLEEALP